MLFVLLIGKLVGEMYDEEVSWYQHYDLSINGETLVVTNSVDLHEHPSFLSYYKLRMESDWVQLTILDTLLGLELGVIPKAVSDINNYLQG